MKITKILNNDNIIQELKSLDKKSVIKELAEPIARMFSIDRKALTEVIMEREKLGTTGIGDGIALPHGKLKDIDTPAIALGISKKGVNFDSIDGQPSHIFFLLLTPDQATVMHLELLAQISGLLRNASLRKALLTSKNKEEILYIIKNGEENLI